LFYHEDKGNSEAFYVIDNININLNDAMHVTKFVNFAP
jgi:hypothetical protein